MGTLLHYEVPPYTLHAVTVVSHRRDSVARVGISPSGRHAVAFLRGSATTVVRNLEQGTEAIRHTLHEVCC